MTRMTSVPIAGGGTSEVPNLNCYCLLEQRTFEQRNSPQPVESRMTGTPQEMAIAIAWWEMRKGRPCDLCHGRFGNGPCQQEQIMTMVGDAKSMLATSGVRTAHA